MIEALYKKYLAIPQVCTDTRKIKSGDLFFALSGPNFNANTFADEALEKGATLCIIDDEKYKKDERYWLVNDVLDTLQALAKHHRRQLSIPIIGLTGSNGKTTTKELISSVLAHKFNVVATKGNLNNHIGVPLTMLAIKAEHEVAIIEMGANHVGEIAALCKIAQPTHGLITNIGKAHIEGFGGFEGIIRGKSELYHHLISQDGVVWINSSNDILNNMAKRFKSPLFYPQKGDFYHCKLADVSPTIELVTEKDEHVKTQLIGAYNFDNIAAALCIGKYFQVPSESANKAVAEYTPDNNRSQIIKKGSKTIILDAYNANPSSMAAALDNLKLMKSDKKAVILGDMNELGSESEKEHRNLGSTLAQANFDRVFLCGPLINAITKQLPEAIYATDTASLKAMLVKEDLEDYLILIKASRSISLENIIDAL